MCINQHDESLMETREDGTRICSGCITKYQGRQNAARRIHVKNRIRNRAQREAPNGSNNEEATQG